MCFMSRNSALCCLDFNARLESFNGSLWSQLEKRNKLIQYKSVNHTLIIARVSSESAIPNPFRRPIKYPYLTK